MTSQLPRFWCLYLSCQQQKNTKNGAAVKSLRSFLFRDDFSTFVLFIPRLINKTVILKVYVIPSAQSRKLTQCQTNNEKIMRMLVPQLRFSRGSQSYISQVLPNSLSTVVHTIDDCVCSKILNHGLFFSFSLFWGEKTF